MYINISHTHTHTVITRAYVGHHMTRLLQQQQSHPPGSVTCFGFGTQTHITHSPHCDQINQRNNKMCWTMTVITTSVCLYALARILNIQTSRTQIAIKLCFFLRIFVIGTHLLAASHVLSYMILSERSPLYN